MVTEMFNIGHLFYKNVKKKTLENGTLFSKLTDILRLWIFFYVWFSNFRNTKILSVQLCSYLHRLHICQSKYRSAPCNSTMPPEFLLYLWDGCVDCTLEFWCLVLDYIVLKFTVWFFFLGYNLKAVPLLDLGECKVYYGHDISSLYFLDLYICLKDSSFLISKICFKRFHFKFIFYLYQWEVTKLAFF